MASAFSRSREILYTHIVGGVLAKLANVRGHSVLPHEQESAVSEVGGRACDRRVGYLVLSGAMEHIHTHTKTRDRDCTCLSSPRHCVRTKRRLCNRNGQRDTNCNYSTSVSFFSPLCYLNPFGLRFAESAVVSTVRDPVLSRTCKQDGLVRLMNFQQAREVDKDIRSPCEM